MMRWFVRVLGRPKWVVFNDSDDGPELGLQVFGVVVAMYKAEVYYPENLPGLRRPAKREFGESLHPPE